MKKILFALVLGLWAVPSWAQLTTNLVSYWKMDVASGNEPDWIGTNSITASGSPGSAAGIINTARTFNGSSQYFEHSDNTSLTTGNVDFSLQAWVYLTSKAATGTILAKYNGPAFMYEYDLIYEQSGDRFEFDIYDSMGSATSAIANNFGSPSLNTWYHVVATYNHTTKQASIVVNAGTANTATATNTITASGGPFNVGALHGSSSVALFWNGRIDEVGFWKNRVLSGADITSLYNGGAGNEIAPSGMGTYSGGIYTANTCNWIDVDAGVEGPIHTAVDGDQVKIPAGSCSWGAGVAVPSGIGITITGAGTPDSSPANFVPASSCSSGGTVITGSGNITLFSATPQFGNSLMRISCMVLDATSDDVAGLYLSGTCSTSGCPNVRVDNVTWMNGFAGNGGSNRGGHGTGAYAYNIVQDVFGVIDHIKMNGQPTFAQLMEINHPTFIWDAVHGAGANGDNSWNQAEFYGTNKFLFVENSTLDQASVSDNESGSIGGGRLVVRFNHFTNMAGNEMFGWHGTESAGRPRSGRAFEVYGNTYTCTVATACDDTASVRGGTGLLWGNTITINGTVNVFFKFNTLRILVPSGGWGTCDGSRTWDTNDGTTYYSGMVTATSPLTVSGSPGWTADQWVPAVTFGTPYAPYSFYDVTQDLGNEIVGNGSNTLTLHSGGSLVPAINDTVKILRATACIDQAGGRGAGVLYTGTDGGGHPTPSVSSAEVASPTYFWSNTFTNNLAAFYIGGNTNRTQLSADFYADTQNQANQASASSPFDGTYATSMGHGTFISPNRRPTTCSTGVGYFATDEGSWNSSGNGFGNGDLYLCTSTNTWTLSYTPYTYPHPLDGIPACVPAKLTFTAQPSNAAIGVSLGTVSVAVQDAGGSTCTSDASTVTIANKGGTCSGMTLGGTAMGGATAGVFSTSNLTENAAGACTLHATDGALTAGDSSSFTISAPTGKAGRSRIRH